MSSATSTLDLESPKNDTHPFAGIPTSITIRPVIAIDLDDVLSQTNRAIADWHNLHYDTKMDLSTFYYYYYWKNPFWGDPRVTMEKVAKFYSRDWTHDIEPMPGAREGLQTLKDMGYCLNIVTARTKDNAEKTEMWIERHFPELVDRVILTGQFEDDGHGVVSKLSKAQVCAELNARFLVDDSAENAMQCIAASPAVPVLLFGEYEWNKRLSSAEDTREEMTYEIRLEANGGKRFWESEELEIPDNAPLWRVRDWNEVVHWVRNMT